LLQAFVAYEALYVPEAFATTTPKATQIQKRWEEGPVWVAVMDGVVVGTVAAVPKGESLYIRSMAILPSTRGQGIGNQLLQNAEAFAKTQGFKRLFLSTTPFLLAAIRLYENFGFQKTDAGPFDLFGTPLFTMEKILKA
jgi:N-acetylglutamate synthase-like GNAT family acetyltransferase